MSVVQIKDKSFQLFIDKDSIAKRVGEIGKQISKDYKDTNPIFICILNGAFVFASDLFRQIDIDAEISFVKLKSYVGEYSTGNVNMLVGLEASVINRRVIIIEDIIDTGCTLHAFMPVLLQQEPESVKIVSLLSKPSARKFEVNIDYTGFEIPNDFVVGYGLDYDGYGRNLPDLYVLNNQ